MPIRVTCTKCHTRFNVSDKFAGKEGPCPKCKTIIRVPKAEEAVVIEAPKPKGPVDSRGQSILKPIRRKETRLNGVQITLIVCSILAYFAFSLIMGFTITDRQGIAMWVMLGISAIALAVPLVFIAYSFLRDQDKEGFWGRDLWVRVAICSVVYALSWLAFPAAHYAFNDSYGIGSYVTAGVAMFGVGTLAAMFCFEFEWLLGAVHFGLYLGAGLFGRFLSGVHTLPVDPPGSNITTTTTTTVLQQVSEPLLHQTVSALSAMIHPSTTMEMLNLIALSSYQTLIQSWLA